MSNQNLPYLKSVHAKHKAKLLRLPNVVGTAISTKKTGGIDTKKPCIVVLVKKKLSKDKIAKEGLVPTIVDDVPTDVVEVGEIRKQLDKKSRLRPALRGCSLGHYRITAGTFGCLVYRDRQPFILSNNHVMADENRASTGDPILQPGPFDGGKNPNDVIATLYEFVPVKFPSLQRVSGWARTWAALGNGIAQILEQPIRFPTPILVQAVNNLVDAAIAKPVSSNDLSNDAFEGDRQPTGVLDSPEIGTNLFKTGRTSCLTTGQITALDATVQVGYDQGTATFEGQLIASPMSQGGDSGSLMQEQDSNRAVGLLFAGSDQTSILNPITDVLNALRVTLQ